MPHVSIPDVSRGDSLEIWRGDTMTVSAEELGDVSLRDKLWFTVKDEKPDADSQAIVQIEEDAGLLYIMGATAGTPANGNIVVTDAARGDLTVTLAAVEAAKLNDTGMFRYDIQVLIGTAVTTLVRGRAAIVGDVTRAVS